MTLTYFSEKLQNESKMNFYLPAKILKFLNCYHLYITFFFYNNDRTNDDEIKKKGG